MLLQKLTKTLRDFEKQSPCYPHRVYEGYAYTESVREKAAETSCLWIIHRIFQLQQSERALKLHDIQLWDFKIFPDSSVLLLCMNGAGETVYYEHRDPVQFPKEDLSFILDHGVLKLRS